MAFACFRWKNGAPGRKELPDDLHHVSHYSDRLMIQSFVFNDGKLVASNLDSDALRLVRADKGLLIWVNLFAPTPEETTTILEDVFSFHPLAIEDCLSVSRYPKIEDYEDYLFLVMHAVASEGYKWRQSRRWIKRCVELVEPNSAL